MGEGLKKRPKFGTSVKLVSLHVVGFFFTDVYVIYYIFYKAFIEDDFYIHLKLSFPYTCKILCPSGFQKYLNGSCFTWTAMWRVKKEKHENNNFNCSHCCTYCGGDVEDVFSTCGIISAFLLFPLGIIVCCCLKVKKCVICDKIVM